MLWLGMQSLRIKNEELATDLIGYLNTTTISMNYHKSFAEDKMHFTFIECFMFNEREIVVSIFRKDSLMM